MRQHIARRAILWVDGLGLAAYFFWLSRQGGKIFYHTDGVFYLLPCLPLIFIFAYVLRGPPHPDDKED